MFVIVVVRFLTRTDKLAVSYIVRCYSFSSRAYDSNLKFFKSTAYKAFDSFNYNSKRSLKASIQSIWCDVVNSNAEPHRINGRVVLIGEGTNKPKEDVVCPRSPD